MSSNNLPDNLVAMNEAHCQLLTDQIKTLESRVRDMEVSLLEQANRLHGAVTERLDSLFDEGTIVEFDAFPGEEGVIKVSNPKSNNIAVGRSEEVFDSLKATREQLDLLNKTIENMQLAR